jgi:hypothetical protein
MDKLKQEINEIIDNNYKAILDNIDGFLNEQLMSILPDEAICDYNKYMTYAKSYFWSSLVNKDSEAK